MSDDKFRAWWERYPYKKQHGVCLHGVAKDAWDAATRADGEDEVARAREAGFTEGVRACVVRLRRLARGRQLNNVPVGSRSECARYGVLRASTEIGQIPAERAREEKHGH